MQCLHVTFPFSCERYNIAIKFIDKTEQEKCYYVDSQYFQLTHLHLQGPVSKMSKREKKSV